jgi:hypothetical protein
LVGLVGGVLASLYHHYQDLYARGRHAPGRETERIDRLFAELRDRAGFPPKTERTVEDDLALLAEAARPVQTQLWAV